MHLQVAMPPSKIFRDDWLLIVDFQPWLSRVEGDSYKAHCTTCKRTLGAELTSVKRHKASRHHIANVERVREEIQQDIQLEEPPRPNDSLLHCRAQSPISSGGPHDTLNEGGVSRL